MDMESWNEWNVTLRWIGLECARMSYSIEDTAGMCHGTTPHSVVLVPGRCGVVSNKEVMSTTPIALVPLASSARRLDLT